jgi:hypothetical protein
MSNTPKRLADCAPVTVSREFEPTGWIDKNGKFHAEVRLRGLHWKAANISFEAGLIIERDYDSFIAALLESVNDPSVESAVRAAHSARLLAKSGAVAPEPEPEPVKPVAKVSPLAAAALAARK